MDFDRLPTSFRRAFENLSKEGGAGKNLPGDWDRAFLLSQSLPPQTPPEVARRIREPGALLGRYVLVEKVGAGGMGTVHRAWDLELSRWTAVKLLNQAQSAVSRERFLREARTAAALDHPGIIPVYEAGQIGDKLYIAMKYVPGESLHGQRPDAREAARILRDAALAVQAAHDRGIIHRDLKPGNLLRDSSGTVYVSDFGIARETRVDTRLTVSGSLLGTPAYMSPEQAKGDGRNVGAASDVYSLGVTLYELLSGAPPFQAPNVYDLLKNIVEVEAPPLPARVGDLRIIAGKCLEKDPVRRYGSAKELAQDLDRFLKGKPILARSPSPAYRLRKAVSRHRALSAGVAAALLLLLAGGIVASVGSSRRKAETEERLRTLWAEAEKEYARKDYGRTMQVLGEYLALQPRDERASRLKRSCEQALNLQKSEASKAGTIVEASEMLRRALEQVKEGKALWRVRTSRREQWQTLFDSATEIVDRAIARYPGLPGGPYTKGEILEAKGRYAAAIEAFDQALQLDPSLPEAWYRRASCNLRLYVETIHSDDDRKSREALAEPYKRQMLKDLQRFTDRSDPKVASDQPSRYAQALLAMLMGKYAEAERESDRLIEETPSREDFWTLKASCQFGRRDYAAALKTLDQLLSDVMPQYEEGYLRRGWTKQRIRDHRGAVSDFERCVTLDPDDGAAHSSLGVSRLELRDYKGGLQSLTEAIQREPRKGSHYVERASFLANTGDIDKALKDLEKAMELNPRYARPYAMRASLKGHRGDYRGALDDCAKSLEIAPEESYAYYARAGIKTHLYDNRGILEDSNRAIELNPFLGQAYHVRAMAKTALGDGAGALSDCDKMIELDPDDAEGYYGRGVIRAELGNLKGAIEDLTRAIDMGFQDTTGQMEGYAHLYRAEARRKARDLKGAAEDSAKAVALCPKDQRAYNARLNAMNELKDYKGIVEVCTRWIEIEARRARIYWIRGVARANLGDSKGGLQDLAKAIAVDPLNLDAYQNRAELRGRLGDAAGKAADLKKLQLLQASPGYASLKLGQVRYDMFDYQAARSAFRKAIELDATFREPLSGLMADCQKHLQPD